MKDNCKIIELYKTDSGKPVTVIIEEIQKAERNKSFKELSSMEIKRWVLAEKQRMEDILNND